MMMHVVFVDMNFRDKWRDHDCHVVLEIVQSGGIPHVLPTPCSTRCDRSCVCLSRRPRGWPRSPL